MIDSKGEMVHDLFVLIVAQKVTLHSFPSGYRSNVPTTNAKWRFAASNGSTSIGSATSSGSKTNQSTFFASLSGDQYTQLMSMFESHLLVPKVDEAGPSEMRHIAGICSPAYSSVTSQHMNFWVIDSGAASHICHDRAALLFIQPVPIYTSVVLPTGAYLTIDYIGSVRLSNDVLLLDVLYVPISATTLLGFVP